MARPTRTTRSKPSSTSAALPDRPFRELPLADRRRLTQLARGLTVLLSNASNLQRLRLVDVAPRTAGRPLVTLSDRGRRCILAAEASGYDTGLTAGQLEDLKEIHKPLCSRRANPQGTCPCSAPAPTRSEALAARTGRSAIAPKLDVVERARALFEPGQVPLGGAVGDLVLDMIGEIERLRGTSTPGGAPPRFYDLQSTDQVKLVDIERASNGSPYGTTRLQVLRLIEEREIPGGGRRYFLTPAGQRVLDDWREAETRARQGVLLRDLTAEVARHAQVLAGINTEFQAAEAQGPRRRSPT